MVSKTTTARNPATGEIIGEVVHTTEGNIEKMFTEARAAQKKWAELSMKERIPYFKRMKVYIKEHVKEIAEVVMKSTGKTMQDAIGTEVLPICMAIDWYCNNTGKILAPKKVSAGDLLFANKSSTIEYLPSGVIGIISPWNYPLSIPFTEIVMGLIAGNSVVYKVAADTVLVGLEIEKIFKAANFPYPIVHHLISRGSTAAKIMFENKVQKLFFTGSVDVGKILMEQASQTLTPVSLELGGKDPMIVLEDADLERAANGACWAGYQNAGQSCGGVERVYVHEKVYDEFVQLMREKTQAMTHGVPTTENKVDMGSMTTAKQLDTVRDQVQKAIDAGAKVVAQSKAVGNVSNGHFFPATLMVNVDHSMELMKEETFGPVIPIMKFKTIDEAIQLANDSDLALTSSVWTNSTTRGREIARRLESGVTTINDHLYTHGIHSLPWGGAKLSGVGRTHGEMGLHEMTEAKVINWDWAPMVKRNMWWYPFSPDTLNGLMYAFGYVSPSSVWDYLSSLTGLLIFAAGRMFTSWSVPKAKKE